MLGPALLSAVLALATPPQLDASTPTAEHPWLFWAGLTSGVRTASGAVAGQGYIGLSRNLTPNWRPELDLGLGYAGGPAQVLTSMRLGIDFDLPLGAATPYAWLAFAHNHESAWDDVKRDPVPDIVGLSENGVVHRTGAEAGLGVNFSIDRSPTEIVTKTIGVRATALALLGDGPPLTIGALAYLGLAF